AGGVHRQANDLDTPLVKFRLDPGHVAELGRADRGEVLRVREQHGPGVPDPFVKLDRPFGGLGLEVRGGVRDGQRHFLPPWFDIHEFYGALADAWSRAEDGRCIGAMCPYRSPSASVPDRTNKLPPAGS